MPPPPALNAGTDGGSACDRTCLHTTHDNHTKRSRYSPGGWVQDSNEGQVVAKLETVNDHALRSMSVQICSKDLQ